MKATKLIYLSLSAIALSLAACSKDEAGETKPSIEVLKSNFSYTYEAGTGLIEVSADGFTVETDAPWLTATANGRTISLSLQKNEGAESRTANLIIKKGADVQRVPITQMGVVNVMSLNDLEFTRHGGEDSFSIERMDSQPTFESSANWLTAEVVDGRLVVRAAAFPAGHTEDRSATLRVRAGLFDRTITVTQKYGAIAYAEVLGEYEVTFKTWEGAPVQTVRMRLEAKEQNKSFTLKGMVADIVVGFDPITSNLTIGYQTLDNNAAFVAFTNGSNSLGWGENLYMTGAWNRSFDTPIYTFSTTHTYNHENQPQPINGILLWINGGQGGWYKDGQGFNSLISFSFKKVMP